MPSPSARLYYLIQYTSGPAQDLMKSCLSMNPEQRVHRSKKIAERKIRTEI